MTTPGEMPADPPGAMALNCRFDGRGAGLHVVTCTALLDSVMTSPSRSIWARTS